MDSAPWVHGLLRDPGRGGHEDLGMVGESCTVYNRMYIFLFLFIYIYICIHTDYVYFMIFAYMSPADVFVIGLIGG